MAPLPAPVPASNQVVMLWEGWTGGDRPRARAARRSRPCRRSSLPGLPSPLLPLRPGHRTVLGRYGRAATAVQSRERRRAPDGRSRATAPRRSSSGGRARRGAVPAGGPWLGRQGPGHERLEQLPGGRGDLLDGRGERRLVGPGRLPVAADLADELQRGGPDLLVGGVRVRGAERLDAAAHAVTLPPAPAAGQVADVPAAGGVQVRSARACIAHGLRTGVGGHARRPVHPHRGHGCGAGTWRLRTRSTRTAVTAAGRVPGGSGPGPPAPRSRLRGGYLAAQDPPGQVLALADGAQADQQ